MRGSRGQGGCHHHIPQPRRADFKFAQSATSSLVKHVYRLIMYLSIQAFANTKQFYCLRLKDKRLEFVAKKEGD